MRSPQIDVGAARSNERGQLMFRGAPISTISETRDDVEERGPIGRGECVPINIERVVA